MRIKTVNTRNVLSTVMVTVVVMEIANTQMVLHTVLQHLGSLVPEPMFLTTMSC